MVDPAKLGLSQQDLYLYNTGTLFHSYRTMGAHPAVIDETEGVRFAVWAPNAAEVRVVGSFNDWNGCSHKMELIGSTGIWGIFVPGIGAGALYKYEIITAAGSTLLKSDPFAFYTERRPLTASIVANLQLHHWQDDAWLEQKKQRKAHIEPLLIYEVHLGSWKIKGHEHFYTYEELAYELVDYVDQLGYTHIEILPLAEHPFDRSWGYQITGYYSVTSRYGTPEQFMRFVDRCHQKGIGVILDWVPGHFCKDDHGLRLFDGTALYESADPNLAEKPLWGTSAFDFSVSEVQSFLISNALFWMDVYHVDGLRVDAVASMIDLHLDKPESMRTFNKFGGTEYLEAIQFLKTLNETVSHYFPHALMIAEDSSSRPGVTAPTDQEGLGFHFKWNMGWMNDSLRYIQLEPEQRPHHHKLVTFSLHYAFSENYVLPLSHDEVVHGKKSLLNKMPGAYHEKFANLRLFYGYWMTHPGKKLLFMGGEFAQFDEWKDLEQLDWKLYEYDLHRKAHDYLSRLNRLYRSLSPLWELDSDYTGFEWIDVNNAQQSMVSFIRKARDSAEHLVAVCNFANRYYQEYRLGVPRLGTYEIIISSDDEAFGGSGAAHQKTIVSESRPMHGKPYSISMTIPPLAFLLLH